MDKPSYESKAMQKNRIESEKLARRKIELDDELKMRHLDYNKLANLMREEDMLNHTLSTANNVCRQKSSTPSTPEESSILNYIDEEEFFELESESIASGHFSTFSQAYIKQFSLKKDAKYKELKKFTFEDKNLFNVYMQTVEERSKLEELNKFKVNLLRKQKNRDPVFAARYAHFKYLKACGKPSNYKLSTLQAPIMTKKTLNAKQLEIIRDNMVSYETPSENENIRAQNMAVKTFSKTCQGDFATCIEKK